MGNLPLAVWAESAPFPAEYSSFDDVDADIRLECVKHSKYYLVFHPEQSLEVLGWLHHNEVYIC